MKRRRIIAAVAALALFLAWEPLFLATFGKKRIATIQYINWIYNVHPFAERIRFIPPFVAATFPVMRASLAIDTYAEEHGEYPAEFTVEALGIDPAHEEEFLFFHLYHRDDPPGRFLYFRPPPKGERTGDRIMLASPPFTHKGAQHRLICWSGGSLYYTFETEFQRWMAHQEKLAPGEKPAAERPKWSGIEDALLL